MKRATGLPNQSGRQESEAGLRCVVCWVSGLLVPMGEGSFDSREDALWLPMTGVLLSPHPQCHSAPLGSFLLLHSCHCTVAQAADKGVQLSRRGWPLRAASRLPPLTLPHPSGHPHSGVSIAYLFFTLLLFGLRETNSQDRKEKEPSAPALSKVLNFKEAII